MSKYSVLPQSTSSFEFIHVYMDISGHMTSDVYMIAGGPGYEANMIAYKHELFSLSDTSSNSSGSIYR